MPRDGVVTRSGRPLGARPTKAPYVATRSQRRSARLRGQSPSAPSAVRGKTKQKTRAQPVRRGRAQKDQDASETESDTETEDEDGSDRAGRTGTASALAGRAPRSHGATADAPVVDKLVDLVARMEANAEQREATRAKERIESEEAHRRERCEMRRFFGEAVEANARQTRLAAEALRQSMETLFQQTATARGNVNNTQDVDK